MELLPSKEAWTAPSMAALYMASRPPSVRGFTLTPAATHSCQHAAPTCMHAGMQAMCGHASRF